MTLHPCILLVDDSPGECELFGRALVQAGVQAELVVTDGNRSAMKYLNDHINGDEPTLVLLDLKLRGELGLDTLRQIKQDIRFLHIPVVILTSSDDARDLQSCYRAGANGYVIKPSTFDELVQCTGDLCRYWINRNRTPDITEARC
ncbi:MAG: response regulator [Nitrospiraceae bacterium]|nr:response regulator [Nitrospiraceae bacterium]